VTGSLSIPSEGKKQSGRSEGVPKLKTNRGAAKRFRKTSTGKVRRRKAFASHILTKKSTKRKRNLGTSTFVDKTNSKAIKKLIPYA
jgi:large subunit ribosomal protein L35